MKPAAIRKLHRRAITLNMKAGELASLTNVGFGMDSHVSDLADSLLDMTEQLTDALDRLVDAAETGKVLAP